MKGNSFLSHVPEIQQRNVHLIVRDIVCACVSLTCTMYGFSRCIYGSLGCMYGSFWVIYCSFECMYGFFGRDTDIDTHIDTDTNRTFLHGRPHRHTHPKEHKTHPKRAIAQSKKSPAGFLGLFFDGAMALFGCVEGSFGCVCLCSGPF